MTVRQPFLRGMRTFYLIWFGSLVSQLGTAMTRFALMIWAYEQTGEATTLALLGFFAFGMSVVGGSVAGVLVDRFDRRKVMMLTDTCSGLMTVFLLVMHQSGGLEIWHLYVFEAVSGLLDAFQVSASSAATTMLVPRDQLPRASALGSLSYHLSRVGAPFLAGILLRNTGLIGVLLFDVVTFCFAVGSLLVVFIPTPPVSEAGQAAKGSFLQEARFGFGYIFARPGLRALTLFFMGVNFLGTLTYLGVMPAMLLSRAGGGEETLANVQTMLGLAAVVGSLVMSVSGGFKRQIHNVLLCGGLSFLLGDFLFAVGRTELVWLIAAAAAAALIPPMSAGRRTIWQRKVEPDVQGRVFATAGLLSDLPVAVGFLVTGPLADRIMEPAMMPGGALAGVFGELVGTGPGTGMALMFVFTSLCGALLCFGGYLVPSLRDVETDLPDAVVITGEMAPAVGD